MSWDAVLFDSDGVLVDSEPISNRVFREMLAEIGLPLSLEETMARYVGRSMPACVALVEEELGRPVPAGWAAEIDRRTFEALAGQVEPVPGVRELLEWLPWPACVASSGAHQKLRTTLGRTGLYERFAGRVFSAADVPRGKPHPDLYLHAAARMGARPSHCAVVEDSAAGVQAGVAAGMTVFAFTGTMDAARLHDAGAHAVFHHMRDLPALLLRHEPG